MAQQTDSAPPAWLLWFAVLGGALAWAVHLFAAWSVVELACTRGHHDVSGIPLRGFAAIATGLPGIVALAALAAGRHLRGRRLPQLPGWKADRVRFMAEVGFWLDALSVLIILLGALAVAMFAPCPVT
ncbi:hypothetical protein [Sphaerisporangium fuscum]|uniref:hypothetical protein n=1 Tax=Sphaerisporangium fuscum TaxID=2835868 RepID=UPI001BDBD3B9|nr:hypothetical protein [Sphaerisporangium fuscum]